jgi:hypothetical protein
MKKLRVVWQAMSLSDIGDNRFISAVQFNIVCTDGMKVPRVEKGF